MEEDTTTVHVTTEAGDSDSPDAPSSLSNGNEVQGPDLMAKPGLMEECQTESDYDTLAEIPSSQLNEENTAPAMQQIEPGHATAPIAPISRRRPADTGFEMDEDDYEALRLSLGIPKRPDGILNRKTSPTAIPSPATPGTQIAQESQITDRHLASPIQLQPRRRPPTSSSTPPSEARNVSRRFPGRPRKRAYQYLEQEAASILGDDWILQKNKLTLNMNDMSNKEKEPQLASKSSSNPQQKRTKSGIQSTLSTATWTVPPKDRLEVVLQPKRSTRRAAYKEADGSSKSVAELPKRGGHRGRGRPTVLSSARNQATNQVEKRAAVISKNISSGRPKNVTRRVIGGRVGVIGVRRSERTNASNLDPANHTTTSGSVEPTMKSVVEPGSRRGRPPGRPKRRGRPPTRAGVSNRQK
ncbi:hypothetical protein MGU_10486 [Metarhizium guizhouense ARSEF 977]|uniref:Uncharacterized protein n=1 Tax=Metarhizium guizhouense (strain ARSEF 977) TaxID=1276136 RepID=A0A0B4G6B7_METGA|nr:hypothetical protein MGU_10486 [Metarhizium guizhouense ARSEF 977]